MTSELPPFGGYADPDVERAYKWILSFASHEEWQARFRNIESSLGASLEPLPNVQRGAKLRPISISEDRVAWYLYLIQTVLYAPEKYEPIQGARVVPIFKRLGADLQLLVTIKNVNERVRGLITTERNQPDAGLFELLVALLWARNGATEIEFLKVSPPEKRPDLRAVIHDEEWYIECKRLSKSSTYSEKERSKWLTMWDPLAAHLIATQSSIILDIVFHVELSTLPDDFLVSELPGKMRLVRPPCVLISNDIWDVSIRPVDYRSIHMHLEKYAVKYPSDQIIELIGGHRDPNRGFTSAMVGQFSRIGDDAPNNYFLDGVTFAAGAYWSCDAERATEQKARDIRKHLSKAASQLPDDARGVVHIGLETLDGQIVEEERYRRIFNTVQQFDARSKDLRWVYCHLFQSYAPPDACWIIDETVYYFGRYLNAGDMPLAIRSVVVPEDESDDGSSKHSVHWTRPPP